MSQRSRRLALGFTLTELMVTVSLAAILAAIALPSFNNVIRNSRMATATNDFIAAVNLARSEAVKTNRGAALCASANGTACGTDWSAGWMVFSDPNGDGVAQTTELVLRYQRVNGIAETSSSRASFRFAARGECRDCNGGAFGSGTSDLVIRATPCSSGQEQVRALRILRTGAVSFQKQVCP